MSPLLVYGAGGHGAAIIAAAKACGVTVDACLDDNPGSDNLLGVEIKSTVGFKFPSKFSFIVAIGDCTVRKSKFENLIAIGGEPTTLIHPRAFVDDEATIGRGSVVLAMASVDPRVVIGQNVIVNIGAIIGHDCLVESHAHISGNVGLSGGSHVGEGAWVGINSCTIQHVRVGEWSYIGAGSVIVRDIPPRMLAFGNPAHKNMRPISMTLHGSTT